jgi:acyl-coenzyme A thioesterase PaaI-like protein
MPQALSDPLAQIRAINASAAFNRWCGIEVLAAGDGHAEIALDWREDLGSTRASCTRAWSGALIDTACGFARRHGGGTRAGFAFRGQLPAPRGRPPLHRPRARGEARPHAGVHGLRAVRAHGPGEKLVATGETLLTPVAATSG